jgi:glyoxylase I family protein
MPIGTKNSIIKGGGMHHVAIQTRDWETSLQFYRDLLGMEVVTEFELPDQKVIILDIGDGSHVEIFEPKTDTPPAGSPAANDPLKHIALATTDARAALEHVRQAGYEVTVEPKDVDLNGLKATIAFFKGPNNEILEFFQTH